MLSLLNVLLYSLVLATVNIPVLGQAVSIFDVTEKVLGLKEADFQNRPRKKTVLARMRTQIRLKYEKLKRTDRGAFKFMQQLYGNSERTAEDSSYDQDAVQNVVDYYKSMTVDQRNILHSLFPVVEKIFSQYNSAGTVTGRQGSHGLSNINLGSSAPKPIATFLFQWLGVLGPCGKFRSPGRSEFLVF